MTALCIARHSKAMNMLHIRRMKKDDIQYAKRLFRTGLAKQTPKGSMSNAEIKEVLDAAITYLSIQGGKINGLVSFTAGKKCINIEFIYAAKPRQGIGRALMLKVAEYSLKHNIASIKAAMSIIDKPASSFYKAMGFSKKKKINSFLYEISASPEKVVSMAG